VCGAQLGEFLLVKTVVVHGQKFTLNIGRLPPSPQTKSHVRDV